MKENYVLSESETQVIGWAYTTYLNKLLGAPTYLVNQIFIAPAYRGQGYATSLLTTITEDADSAGVILILDFQPAEFSSDATRLQLLYERFGFTWDETIGGMRRPPTP